MREGSLSGGPYDQDIDPTDIRDLPNVQGCDWQHLALGDREFPAAAGPPVGHPDQRFQVGEHERALPVAQACFRVIVCPLRCISPLWAHDHYCKVKCLKFEFRHKMEIVTLFTRWAIPRSGVAIRERSRDWLAGGVVGEFAAAGAGRPKLNAGARPTGRAPAPPIRVSFPGLGWR
jgi:hypothetical protein